MKPAVHSVTFGIFSSLAFLFGFIFNMISLLWHSCFTKFIHYYLPKQTVNPILPHREFSEELKDNNSKKFMRKELLGGDIEWTQDSQDILKLPSEDDFINHISRFDQVCSIDNLEMDCKRRNTHYRLTTGVEVRDHPLRRSISAKEIHHECCRFRKVIEEMKDVIDSSRLLKAIEESEDLNESIRLSKTMEDQNESCRLQFKEETEGPAKSSRLKKMVVEDLTESSKPKRVMEETEDLTKISEYKLAVEGMAFTGFHERSTDNLIELKESIDKIKKVFNPEEYIPSSSKSSLDYFEYIIRNTFKDAENFDDNVTEEDAKILYGEERNGDLKLKAVGGDAKNSDSKRSSKSKVSNEDLEVLIDKINEIVDDENSLEIVCGKLILRTASSNESNLKSMTGTFSANFWKGSGMGAENEGFCASLSGIDEEEAVVSRNINFPTDSSSFQQLPEKSPDDDNFECVDLSSSSSQGSEVELIKRPARPPTFPAKMSALGRQARTALTKMSTNKMKTESKASFGKLKERLKIP